MRIISVLPVLFGGFVAISCTSNQPHWEGPSEHASTEVVALDEAQKKKERVVADVEVSVSEVSIEKVFELQQTDSVLLIDTRPSIFYTLGHIEGAVSLPLKSFEKSFSASREVIDAALASGKKVVIYCQSEKCKSSHKMAQKFAQKGYDSSIFKGGWELWKISGL